MRDALQPIVLSRAYGAAFPYALLRFVSPLGPTPRFPLEKRPANWGIFIRRRQSHKGAPGRVPNLD
jgi:hypothetical protein